MNDDDLMTLKDASEILFGGKVSPTTLKEQWRKGNLDLSKIGRSYFAPVSAFKGLQDKCRVEAPGRASGSISRGAHGQSSTVEAAIAQGSALRKLDELKQHFSSTSKRSTDRPLLKRRLSRTY